MEEYTVVRRVAKDKAIWGLTNGKCYAVETDEGYVDKADTFITVWNDNGRLAEMEDGEYEVVTVDEREWFKVRPNRLFVDLV